MPGPAFPQAPLGDSKMDSSVRRFTLSGARSNSIPHDNWPNPFSFLYLTISHGESYIYRRQFWQIILPQWVSYTTPPGGWATATSVAALRGRRVWAWPLCCWTRGKRHNATFGGFLRRRVDYSATDDAFVQEFALTGRALFCARG
jgi:hypothetical protein